MQPLRSTENHLQIGRWQDVPTTATNATESGCIVRTQSAPTWSAGALHQLFQQRRSVFVGRLPVTDVTRPSHLQIGHEYATTAAAATSPSECTSHPVHDACSMPVGPKADISTSSPNQVRGDQDPAACCDVRVGSGVISFRLSVQALSPRLCRKY